MPFDAFTFSPVTVAAPATPVQLPHVPSALIRLALADLEKVERTPGYRVQMSTFHTVVDGACWVCLAGAVIATTLGRDRNEDRSPSEENNHNARALQALSCFRHPIMDWGCEEIGAREIEFDTDIPAYRVDRDGFHAAMHALADAFERSGQ